MTATAFNTHEVAEILSQAGFPKEQVNAQVRILTEVTGELVKKSDLETELSLLKKDLIISLGIMQLSVAVLILVVIKFIIIQ